MPIHRQNLLKDLRKWVTRFEGDLREQCREVPALDARLKAQHKAAKDAGRTAFSYAVWRDGELTQSAVAWVLSCVFVRFLEDNGLLESPFLSGSGEAREAAGETRAAYFTVHRTHSDADYLAHVFGEVGSLPGMADLMDARHNALWNASISGDAAKDFIEFWRRIDPATGALAHDFADPEWDTRFLGDLYQDLSEAARKKFALLQTPDFVEEFILDRTFDPAINVFGLKVVRMIDPTCGSGHFLLGAFRRLLRLWQKERPDLGDRELAAKALAGVYGVDLNPFAVAIARFRLLLAAWRFCGVKRLRNAPDFHVNLAVGDSLIHGARFDSGGKPYVVARDDMFGGDEAAFQDETAHHFEVEDAAELHRILGQQYHAVVGNPPYITVKDKALNELYRKRYDACSGKYALSVPFMERFFDLAVAGSGDGRQPAGFTGQITSNSFMKREFGKKLIEEQIPKWDLTHVLDTSGAYIPGHGTPTVILFGRNAKPAAAIVRTVMGIKGEPATPEDPAKGKVWSAIVDQVDRPGSESEFVSAADTEREKFHKHPWSIGGGGAAELREGLEASSKKKLGKVVDQLRGKPNIGITSFTLEDDLYVQPQEVEIRHRVPSEHRREMVEGDTIRDWDVGENAFAVWPYDSKFRPVGITRHEALHRFMWVGRTSLENSKMFGGKTKIQAGLRWYEYGRLTAHKLRTPLSITFAEVATHNHFVLDRGGKVFKQTAPVIKLPADATVHDHLRLLGLLNSAAACFWMKQVFHCKGSTVDQHGARQTTVPFEDFYQIDGTKLKQFPVVEMAEINLVVGIQKYAEGVAANSPERVLESWDGDPGDALTERLGHAQAHVEGHRHKLIYWQEELDWQVYELYGLIERRDDLALHGGAAIDTLYDAGLTLGERAFEIRMARRMKEEVGTMNEEGEETGFQTTWFERHKEAGSKPITDFPAHWPADYRALVERRLAFIEANKNLNLIERPEYKRRWNTEPWAKRRQEALRKWLLARLEAYFHDADRMIDGPDEAANATKLAHIHPIRARFAGGAEPKLVSLRQLAAAAETDPQWMEAATVYAGRADFKVAKVVGDLVLAESVPALPADRYKPSGLRKRVEWERTWDLQRREDAVEEEVRTKKSEGRSEDEVKALIRQAQKEEVGDIPVPPKYGSGDFAKSAYWKLRGKLDVPKERWILYPGAEGGYDESPVIAWAGWNHAQQAQALAGFHEVARTTWGWDNARFAPLLAALKELLPWLHQWHADLDPTYGDRPSETYQTFYEEERHTLQMTDEDVEIIRMGGAI